MNCRNCIWFYPTQRSHTSKENSSDQVRRLYKESKNLASYATQKLDHQRMEELARSIKRGIILLDISTRNLTQKKVNKLVKEEKLNSDEGKEYKIHIHD